MKFSKETSAIDLIPRSGRGVGVAFSDNSWDDVGVGNVDGIFLILKNAWDFTHANRFSWIHRNFEAFQKENNSK